MEKELAFARSGIQELSFDEIDLVAGGTDWGAVVKGGLWGSVEGSTVGGIAGGLYGGLVGPGGAIGGFAIGAAGGALGGLVWGGYVAYRSQQH